MKKTKQKMNLPLIALAFLVVGMMASCSKSSSSGGNNTTPPPTNPGGYDSSNQIQSAALITFFPFNGSLNDVKGGMVGTNNGSTFGSGMNGKQAYQGGADQTYVVYPTSSAIKSMTSFTISFWLNSAQVDSGAQAILQLSNANQYWPELDIDLETHGSPTQSTDSLNMKMYMENAANNVWTVAPQGWMDTAVGKWTHFVTVYNAAAGSVTWYQNGTSIAFGYPYAPAGGSTGPIVFYTSDPGSSTNTNGAPAWGNADFSVSSSLVIGAWQGKVNPPLNPGQGSDTWNHSFMGMLQNLRIYNTAMNATDVKSLYILEQAGF